MQHEFDALAQSYDSDFTNSEIGKLQRRIVWNYLDKQNITGKNILEINCGTGEDAVFFAQNGNLVSSTDASEQMLLITQKKSRENNCAIDTFVWDLNQPFPFQGKKYDLIFSNFGGINCISPEALKNLSLPFQQLLHSDGKLIFVVMGKFCLWETLYFLIKGKFKSAFRRQSKKSVRAKLNESTFVDTWYYSSNEFKQTFQQPFKISTILPVGILIPPSYLKNYFSGRPRFLHLLSKADKLIQQKKIMHYISDHYLIEMKKNKNSRS